MKVKLHYLKIRVGKSLDWTINGGKYVGKKSDEYLSLWGKFTLKKLTWSPDQSAPSRKEGPLDLIPEKIGEKIFIIIIIIKLFNV